MGNSDRRFAEGQKKSSPRTITDIAGYLRGPFDVDHSYSVPRWIPECPSRTEVVKKVLVFLEHVANRRKCGGRRIREPINGNVTKFRESGRF
jgi:hypothetical protein